MFNGSFSRNMHGDNEDTTTSPLPGSESVYVRDVDDIKDATHGGFRSPKLDSRSDRGSLRWALLAGAAAIVAGLGTLALLGWASGQRVNRTEVPETVLHQVTCRAVGDQVFFSATYNKAAGADVEALADADGLEVEVNLLDNMGVLVDKKTAWVDFNPAPGSGLGMGVSVDFAEQVEFPRCVPKVWAA